MDESQKGHLILDRIEVTNVLEDYVSADNGDDKVPPVETSNA